MQFSLLALLSVAFAAPIAVESQAASGLEPLIYVSQDGSLYLGGDAKEKLLSHEAQNIVKSVVERSLTANGLSKREAVDPKINFCLGGHQRRPRHRYPPPPPPCVEPCVEPIPCEPIPEPCFDPCAPVPEPCYDPCYDPCYEDDTCGCADELRASCYTKWFCPSTYCNGCEGICPEGDCYNDNHPVVDSLRNCCATKWMCPSTYCPSNWGCGGCGCDNSCNDPCYDPCDPCNN